MSTVNLWELYCTTESAYKSVWSIAQPDVCPDNNTHSINSNPGPRIINSVSDTKVKIIEEDGITQGIYKFRGFSEPIPEGVPGTVTTITHVWPYPITLINGWFLASKEMIDDEINLVVAENTVVGAITAPVTTGDTVISVTNTVFVNAAKGFYLNLTDGSQLSNLGEIVDMDPVAGTVTVEIPSNYTFSPLSPTYVRMSVGVIENFAIPIDQTRYAFAEKKVGGKYIKANIPIKVKYTNNSGNAKVFSYNMEYLY